MKFTLKDYQSEAVGLLLERLERAQSEYRESGQRSSVSLCATTGAGKTVMAAAVIEALFYGDDLEFEADPGAVVVWFSDDPSLNEQTRNRLMEASDQLTINDLVTIEFPFPRNDLEPGKVYFLNTQKLSKTSKLTRGGAAPDDPSQEGLLPASPDDQSSTIWDILRATIEQPDRTVYLIIDEAHRGFGTKSSREKATIVSGLVSGTDLVPAAPIVVGVSATIGKFSTAMSDAAFEKDRIVLPAVNVDGARVQESGLLKDTVVLDFTTEAGVFDRALVRRAAEKLTASTTAWQEYAQSQSDPSAAVVPLLVLQIPNTPNWDQVGDALDVISEVVPSLDNGAVRHVLGEHTDHEFGSWTVSWIEPQYVQGRTEVRVLIAKEAISTGWDCPRAEVMVSFRTAKEQDHITQVLGRMVRNPLARRIPGDDRLNSVDCLLPYFDRTTAGKVVKALTGLAGDQPTTQTIMVDGRDTRPNPTLGADVWDAWQSMPTELLPQRGVRPISRLLQLATNLARDGVRPGAGAVVTDRLIAELEAAAHTRQEEVIKARQEILTIHGMTISGTTGSIRLAYDEFTMVADAQAIGHAYADARKAFGDVARAFVDRRVTAGSDLTDATVEIASLATVSDIRASVDRAANRLFDEWDHVHRKAIAGLPDLRRAEYDDIRAQAPEPQLRTLIAPRVRLVEYGSLDGDQTAVVPAVGRHLTSDDEGDFPITALNAWERIVISAELAKSSTAAWYRNPPRSAGDSLCIAYRDEFGNWRGLYPDFVIFERVGDAIKPSIVDPHRQDLPDALRKLRALADFAKKHGAAFHRIESVIVTNGKIRRLDLQRANKRKDVDYWSHERPVVELYPPPVEIAVDFALRSDQ